MGQGTDLSKSKTAALSVNRRVSRPDLQHACGWRDPVLDPWVPRGWYSDPANPPSPAVALDSDDRPGQSGKVIDSRQVEETQGVQRTAALLQPGPPCGLMAAVEHVGDLVDHAGRGAA
jgi:hypothetical protein